MMPEWLEILLIVIGVSAAMVAIAMILPIMGAIEERRVRRWMASRLRHADGTLVTDTNGNVVTVQDPDRVAIAMGGRQILRAEAMYRGPLVERPDRPVNMYRLHFEGGWMINVRRAKRPRSMDGNGTGMNN